MVKRDLNALRLGASANFQGLRVWSEISTGEVWGFRGHGLGTVRLRDSGFRFLGAGFLLLKQHLVCLLQQDCFLGSHIAFALG